MYQSAIRIEPEKWGKDHWSTLMYIETLCVDHGGVPDHRRMRPDGNEHPTRLRGGELQREHNDWDCAEDMEHSGLIRNIGTGANPKYEMTGLGWKVAGSLRQWKAQGCKLIDYTIPDRFL